MKVGDICVREFVSIEENKSASAAAGLMRLHEVTSVLVAEKINGLFKPLGVVSDHDLVMEIVAPNRDAKALTVGEVMRSELILAREEDSLWEVTDLMRDNGLRQVPVVDEQGYLTGVFRIDDLLQLVTAELTDLVKLIDHEQSQNMIDRT